MKPITTLSLSVLILGCQPTPSETSRTQSMIETSDLRLVSMEQSRTGPALYQSLGALSEPVIDPEFPEFAELYALCTGIQISPKYVLTAGHCKSQRYVFNKNYFADQDSLDQLRFKAFGKMIRLIFDGEAVPESNAALQYPTESAPVYASADLDFAIWEFKDLPENGWIDIRHYSQNWQQLSLLGYPNGAPLTVAEPCRGQASAEDPTRILHDCDSLSGSSGGLVWDQLSGLPVALHVQSTSKNDADYWKKEGIFEGSNQIGLNQAVGWSSILDDITRHHPQLTKELKLTLKKDCP
ncbi:MAG TPA: serine protease [Oligoflexus sp.]|uniref:trypsin-like serine peptidase n=1 Tax=Oligoflexus sp. TaxID=1971216 RepID=UPI002D71A405|nr:serine protease [Oligoflexus sp.]HYX35465.1 serine protease [Oligoflexus sp.]